MLFATTWVTSRVVDDVVVVVVVVVVVERTVPLELFVMDTDLYVSVLCVSKVVTVVLIEIEVSRAAAAPSIAELFFGASVTSFTSISNLSGQCL